MRKLLKDYPKDAWLDAADSCEFCGRRYAVKITLVDEGGCFGSVKWIVHHQPDCPEGIENGKIQEGWDFAGWSFTTKPIKFKGREYYPLKARANVGPCLECGRLVIGVPLILFIDQGRGGELDFCFECAEKLGLLRDLTR